MTACVYCLAMYPDCLTAIAEESDKLSLSAEPMADDLGRLQYREYRELIPFVNEYIRVANIQPLLVTFSECLHPRSFKTVPSCSSEVCICSYASSLIWLITVLHRHSIRRSNQAVLLPPLDTTSPPLVFPADTSVILSTLSIQRDESVWGPDAQAFDPCRWLESDPRAQKGYPFGLPGFGKAAFPAFHLGPRTASPGNGPLPTAILSPDDLL